ncbi:hypothetical protein EV213_12816 [Aureibacillus halotolerans]|uniref:Uncharacterized protein n=1 Tax=Aureibacillus halotolerans TaxID=1508390 RepID=A0A4R6TQQ0_9BACI|nr:hypothetical protein EV213_12816 [Aureibacillus halotolerans]
MAILLIIAILFAVSLYLRMSLRHPYSFSIGLFTTFGLFLICTIFLLENYMTSLSPKVHDGIGISNKVA